MQDAERKNAKDYRKEEWVAFDAEPREVDAAARKGTRGRFFVCAVRAMDEDDQRLKEAYKKLGYRLLGTEPLFVHRLKKIPRPANPISIERLRTPEMAIRFGKATRTRPIRAEDLVKDAPSRQYVALDDGEHRASLLDLQERILERESADRAARTRRAANRLRGAALGPVPPPGDA